jgi:hypothetical protein
MSQRLKYIIFFNYRIIYDKEKLFWQYQSRIEQNENCFDYKNSIIASRYYTTKINDSQITELISIIINMGKKLTDVYCEERAFFFNYFQRNSDLLAALYNLEKTQLSSQFYLYSKVTLLLLLLQNNWKIWNGIQSLLMLSWKNMRISI